MAKKMIDGVEVEVDENGNPVDGADLSAGLNFDDPDFDAEAEVLKRGGLNLLKENKKKGKENHDLKERLKALEAPKPPAGKAAPKLPNAAEPKIVADYRAMMKKKGFDDEYIDGQLQMTGYVSDNIAAQRMKPADKLLYGDALDATIKEVGKNPKLTFATQKFAKEIKDYIQTNYGSQLWSDPELVKSVTGIIIADNTDKLSDNPAPEDPDKPPVEDRSGGGKPPAKAGAGTFSEEAIQSYATRTNLDINVQGVRESVIRSLAAQANIAKRNEQ